MGESLAGGTVVSRGGLRCESGSLSEHIGPFCAAALRAMSGPHDLLVRFTFSHPERAASELRVALPPQVVAQVDWASLQELFDVPTEQEPRELWRSLAPRFEYLLDDLTTERAEALMARPGSPLARLALLALRFGRTEELSEQLPGWRGLFVQALVAPHGDEELSVVFHYLMLVGTKPRGEPRWIC